MELKSILFLLYPGYGTGATEIQGTGGIDIFPTKRTKIGEGQQFCLPGQESGQAEEAYTLGR